MIYAYWGRSPVVEAELVNANVNEMRMVRVRYHLTSDTHNPPMASENTLSISSASSKPTFRCAMWTAPFAFRHMEAPSNNGDGTLHSTGWVLSQSQRSNSAEEVSYQVKIKIKPAYAVILQPFGWQKNDHVNPEACLTLALTLTPTLPLWIPMLAKSRSDEIIRVLDSHLPLLTARIRTSVETQTVLAARD